MALKICIRLPTWQDGLFCPLQGVHFLKRYWKQRPLEMSVCCRCLRKVWCCTAHSECVSALYIFYTATQSSLSPLVLVCLTWGRAISQTTPTVFQSSGVSSDNLAVYRKRGIGWDLCLFPVFEAEWIGGEGTNFSYRPPMDASKVRCHMKTVLPARVLSLVRDIKKKPKPSFHLLNQMSNFDTS